MLRDEGVVVEATWSSGDGSGTHNRADSARELHRDIDRELRRIANRRATLDADEARWLREAERHRIWRKLGFATALEYLEDVFGHAPRTAKDRLRVAKALGELPGLEAELRRGAMSYSAVKELTRVMTPATEAQWIASARGRNVRDVGELVEGRKKGDLPSDPKDPSLITRDVVFTLDARRLALLEQARAMFEAERGEHVENAALLEALCMSALRAGATAIGATAIGATVHGPTANGPTANGPTANGPTANGPTANGPTANGATANRATVHSPTADAAANSMTMCGTAIAGANEYRAASTAGARVKAPRPAHQIVVRKCDDCARAWMPGRGKLVEIPRSDAELVECDADIVREEDVAAAQAAGKRRPKPTSTIPTKTRDLVWARDEGRCRFPGCRATRHLELHHIVFRKHGGSHDAWNLILLCGGHHTQLHEGNVSITGRAPNELVFMRDGGRLVDSRARTEQQAAAQLVELARPASRFAEVIELEAATQALRQLGYKTREARRVLAQARAHVGAGADVPTLVRAVLDLTRRTTHAPGGATDESLSTLATRALMQSGFSPTLASHAVAQACERVDTDDLATLIKESLRHCRE